MFSPMSTGRDTWKAEDLNRFLAASGAAGPSGANAPGGAGGGGGLDLGAGGRGGGVGMLQNLLGPGDKKGKGRLGGARGGELGAAGPASRGAGAGSALARALSPPPGRQHQPTHLQAQRGPAGYDRAARLGYGSTSSSSASGPSRLGAAAAAGGAKQGRNLETPTPSGSPRSFPMPTSAFWEEEDDAYLGYGVGDEPTEASSLMGRWNRKAGANGSGVVEQPQRRIRGGQSLMRRNGPLMSQSSLSSREGGGGGKKRPVWKNLFRPDAETVQFWLDSWWLRWLVMAGFPSLVVWLWCAVPFPLRDPDDGSAPWCDPSKGGSDAPWCKPRKTVGAFTSGILSLASSLGMASSGSHADKGSQSGDANFWFFLVFYYGIYCAVGLIYITQLFSLYRLNWWPSALGAKKSYFFFWLLSICAGYTLHAFSLDAPTWWRDWTGGGAPSHEGKPHHGGSGPEDDTQWQRKTLWVGLAFATMSMPALVCLAGLRRSGRQNYRHSLTDMQKTFLERQLARRIPASYTRFLWFMATIGLALVALLAGQGYASVYLRTLPHTGLDGTAYVAFWTINVNVLLLLTSWILEEKVRSRALLFVFKYYYFLVYFVFYRNLFARLRSFDQFALVQLLSSFWVCIWYPFSMTSLCHRVVQYFNPDPKSWEEYVESVGLAFYLRNLAQNTTMVAFLGWLSILHFGPNQHLYPYFAFEDKRDPYNYQLTMLGSLAIWGSELLSSFVARQICLVAFSVDVTNLGLDEMRAYPELTTSVLWASVHVLQDMLLFLVKLNFR